MKKLLTCLLLIASLVCLWGCDEEEDNRPRVADGYFTYILQEDGTYSITATDIKDFPEEITIPKYYDGVEVTAIEDEAFARCPTLRKVVIPDSIKKVPYGAFYMCPALEKVELPSTIKSIEGGAFGLCKQPIDFYYDGTEDDWDRIPMKGNWAAETEYYVYCSDGIVESRYKH